MRHRSPIERKTGLAVAQNQCGIESQRQRLARIAAQASQSIAGRAFGETLSVKTVYIDKNVIYERKIDKPVMRKAERRKPNPLTTWRHFK